ncbi:uncharacterized protein BDZ99DRAFT_485766 [Mytilinidion resinicola]|uniref:gamma-glutamylcyclotransferase n=1 Tax=Mytilinidion resinicola TaxID=574789 RepID=A0A6A6Z3B8_9PEZI|nr:uncharacterized protein BDZ99DRAFT_485766 [Mytilinidion resinicola]KAF2815500.1 hypothetical protein BDZ99DRAFT_485766 [Mytilinidion resinicola]
MDGTRESARWYFAYGSNMSATVFKTNRKIQPLETEVACIKSHTLCFNIPGVPYTEPGMGGIRAIKEDEKDVGFGPVYGVAYLLSDNEFGRVIASEGSVHHTRPLPPRVCSSDPYINTDSSSSGGIAYKVTKTVATFEKDNTTAIVYTLTGRHDLDASYDRLPSYRYMSLLIRGAHELSLPPSYQEKLVAQPTFNPPQTLRYSLGKRSFDALWKRVQYCIIRGVRQFKSDDGHVPGWFLKGFDCLMWTMWLHHDYVHSKIWGRGDRR